MSIFNFALVKYYTDPVESIKSVLAVQVVALTIISMHALLIPLDQENVLQRNQGTSETSPVGKLLAQANL